ncbi:hypothetical protein [Shivajiella indica]|uniref:PorT family protein n=1 Tax=Shivajiella indica TaxID=872115 RepID=A0ABW5B4L0_9BACT
MKRIFLPILFLTCFQAFGQEAEEAFLSDSIPAKKTEMKMGIRLSPSLNFFDYGDLSFGQIASDNKFGIALGMAFDWKVTDWNRFRIEPYLEYQMVSNNSINPNISAITTFNNFILGLDALPLVLTYGGKIKGQVSFGGFAKYYLSSSQKTTLDGDPVSNFEVETNSLQYGFSYGIGAYIGKRLVELRYYQSLNDFVKDPVISNSINQVQLILVY